MRKILIIIYISILFIENGLAQDYYIDYQSKVIPPTPTSSVFKKFGNHTPSLSTGAVDISIPLYELKLNNFILPFSLQYHTSGINVNDIPYPTGYGWTLTPGLRVTRTIMGRPDDIFPFKEVYGNEDYYTFRNSVIKYPGLPVERADLYDTQRDIFTIHLPSGNYNFIINKNDDSYTAHSIGNQLKIEFIIDKKGIIPRLMAKIIGFKITDENGYIYIFGMTEDNLFEDSYVETPGNSDISGYNSWLLREIILLDNSKINFSWKSNPNNAHSYEVRAELPLSIIDFKEYACDDTPNPEMSVLGGFIDFPYKEVRLLDKINFQTGTIKINYKSKEEPFITSFEVKDNNKNINRNIIFLYGTKKGYTSFLLEELQIDNEAYKFYYNDTHFSKGTRGLDYWGYYNGKEENLSLIPKIWPYLYYSYQVTPTFPKVLESYGDADKSIDKDKMQAYMLKRIEYPTGGYSEFKYEPHRFEGQKPISKGALDENNYRTSTLSEGGGLRVTEIRTCSDSTSIPIIKTYKYGKNENGLANIEYAPTLDTFVDECFVISSTRQCVNTVGGHEARYYRLLYINSFSNVARYMMYDQPIWYDTVAEYINDNKIIYTFEKALSLRANFLQSQLFSRSYSLNTKNLFGNGVRIKSEILYLKDQTDYKPIVKMLYEYNDIFGGAFKNFFMERNTISSNLHMTFEPDFDYDDSSYYGFAGSTHYFNLHSYSIDFRYYPLSSKKVISYIGNDSILTSESYLYSQDSYGAKTRLCNITKTSSDGIKQVVEYKFPNDYTDDIHKKMIEKNIRSPKIEEITYKEEKEISRIKTNFTNNASITNGLFLPMSQQISYEGVNDLKELISFNKYDFNGNILQLMTKEGIVKSYLWSYSGQYPIAEIVNASYEDVKTALGVTPESISELASPDMSKIDALRGKLPNAQITTYTYKPLVGMLTATDPRGVTTYYDYDDFGRLKRTYIQEGGVQKTIETYKYHYRNQQD